METECHQDQHLIDLFEEAVNMSSINGVMGPLFSFKKDQNTRACNGSPEFKRTKLSCRIKYEDGCIFQRTRSSQHMLGRTESSSRTEHVVPFVFKRMGSDHHMRERTKSSSRTEHVDSSIFKRTRSGSRAE